MHNSFANKLIGMFMRFRSFSIYAATNLNYLQALPASISLPTEEKTNEMQCEVVFGNKAMQNWNVPAHGRTSWTRNSHRCVRLHNSPQCRSIRSIQKQFKAKSRRKTAIPATPWRTSPEDQGKLTLQTATEHFPTQAGGLMSVIEIKFLRRVRSRTICVFPSLNFELWK